MSLLSILSFTGKDNIEHQDQTCCIRQFTLQLICLFLPSVHILVENTAPSTSALILLSQNCNSAASLVASTHGWEQLGQHR